MKQDLIHRSFWATTLLVAATLFSVPHQFGAGAAQTPQQPGPRGVSPTPAPAQPGSAANSPSRTPNSVQTTGVPGSAGATTTVDGRYLPNPPQPFGGQINIDAKNSKPSWPANVVPPKGAPNVLLIMTDDAGYGVSGTFGGVIPTPTKDRVAKMGLRYTHFNSTALCSPTRAALITGRNHRLRRHLRTSDRLPWLRLHHRRE